MSDLIARLRHGATVVGQSAVDDGTSTFHADLMIEAADAIRELQARLSLAEIALSAQVNRITMRDIALADAVERADQWETRVKRLEQDLVAEREARPEAPKAETP